MTLLSYTLTFADTVTAACAFTMAWSLARIVGRSTRQRSASLEPGNSSLKLSQVYDMCQDSSGRVMCIRHCMWNMTECQNRCVLAKQVETLYQTSPFGERAHGRA